MSKICPKWDKNIFEKKNSFEWGGTWDSYNVTLTSLMSYLLRQPSLRATSSSDPAGRKLESSQVQFK